MARGKKEKLSLEELVEQAVVKEEEQPYEVPGNWKYIKLGALLEEIKNGTTIKQNKNKVGAMVTRIESIQNNRIDFSRIGYIEDTSLIKESDWYMANDIAISHINSVEHVGKAALINKEILPLVHGMNLLRLRLKYMCNAKYFFYYTQSFEYKASIVERINMAVNQVSINQKQISDLPIPLPPLAEQQRIVDRIESLFEKLDTAKELAQNALDSFENRKAAILHKAFTGELTAKWREENPITNNNIPFMVLEYYKECVSNKNIKQIIENQQHITKILEIKNSNWYKCNIGSIAVVTNGSTPSRQNNEYWNGDIPWVSSGEVRNNIISKTKEQITQEGYDNSSVKLLPKGTVLIAMIGEGKTRGQSAVLDIDATTNQNVAAIDVSHQQVESRFIWYWLQKQYQKNRDKGNGTGPQALNCQKVRELEFVLPPLKEQQEIVRILDGLLDNEQQAQELCNVIEKIDLMKKAILARAFRGELGTNNPEEESAIELLKEVLKEKL